MSSLAFDWQLKTSPENPLIVSFGTFQKESVKIAKCEDSLVQNIEKCFPCSVFSPLLFSSHP